MTGTVAGQLIPVLASPLLARLYSSEQFGVLALYMGVSTLFVLIAGGRYEMAIVLPLEKRKALNIVGLSLTITLGMTLLSFLLMYFLREIFSGWFRESMLNYYLLFIPLSVFFMGIYQTLYNWALREKKFKIISTSRILQSVIGVVVTIVLAYSDYLIHGLIFGFIAGQIAGSVFICLSILPSGTIQWNLIHKAEMKAAAIEYKNFPMISTAHVMLDSFQSYGLIFLLSLLFGNVVLGWYSFSYRILRAPLAFIGAAFSQVLFQQMSEMKNNSISFKPLVTLTIKRIFFIGLPFFLILILFAPLIFKFLFGTEWESAGRLAQIMVPWLFLNFLCSPISHVPNILNEQKKFFLINLIGGLGSFAILYFATLLYSSVEIPFLYFSLASAGYFLYLINWIIKISDNNEVAKFS